MNTIHFVSTFYKFINLADVETVKKDLNSKAKELNISGLIIIGTEGFNATISVESLESFEIFKQFIRDYFKSPELFFKDSESNKKPFKRFVVKIREEIVTLGTPELIPDNFTNKHLTPEEWDNVLKNEKDFLLIDTRNWYETKIGTFKGAINPGIDNFQQFPEYMEKNNFPKNKKVLIFCTGGIRCEKGILELQRQGYDNVYQLYGGIINYIKEKPNQEFEGECFVFDHRVALDQELKPSQKFDLCPHCGQPGSIKIKCSHCDTEQKICESCIELEWKKETCSKNCAYQYELKTKKTLKIQNALQSHKTQKNQQLFNETSSRS